jgi:hypothetical protein
MKALFNVNQYLALLVKKYVATVMQCFSHVVDDVNHNFSAAVMTVIADVAQKMPHTPRNENVRRAYAAFIGETVAQWHFLIQHGYSLKPWRGAGQPYAASWEMIKDVREHKRLYFFTGGDMPSDHPLAQLTGIIADGIELTANDVFRAVHDIFGHATVECSFGARGEFNATHQHARLYSAKALPAMIGETVYQNAWVNFGAHLRRADGTIPQKGDADYTAPENRPYAQQKALDITKAHLALWRSAYSD